MGGQWSRCALLQSNSDKRSFSLKDHLQLASYGEGILFLLGTTSGVLALCRSTWIGKDFWLNRTPVATANNSMAGIGRAVGYPDWLRSHCSRVFLATSARAGRIHRFPTEFVSMRWTEQIYSGTPDVGSPTGVPPGRCLQHLHPGLRPEHPLLIGSQDQRFLAGHVVRLC
jgi:hypothetical protein